MDEVNIFGYLHSICIDHKKTLFFNKIILLRSKKQKRVLMTSDLKAMISSSNRDDGPSTSKRARDGPSTSKRARLMENNQATSSRDGEPSQSQSSEGRSMGHREQILDDSSDSDSSVESKGKGLLANLKRIIRYNNLTIRIFF